MILTTKMVEDIALKVQFGGLTVITNSLLVERVAYPRSPGRSRRRARQGHPQHYAVRPIQKVFIVDGSIFMHPEVLKAVRVALSKQEQRKRP